MLHLCVANAHMSLAGNLPGSCCRALLRENLGSSLLLRKYNNIFSHFALKPFNRSRCFYLSFVVFGEISSTKDIHVVTAQRFAAAAFKDGLTESTLRDIASLATWGKHQQNAERDLHKWMPFAYGSQLSTHSTSIDIYNPDTAKIEQKEIPILLATDVLEALWRRGNPKLWDTTIGATKKACGDYWGFAEDDWAQDHPVILHFGCTQLKFEKHGFDVKLNQKVIETEGHTI